MDDLQIAPPRERSALPAVLIAVLVLVAVFAALFFFNPRKTAELHVTNVQVFAPRTEFKASQNKGGMNIIGQPGTVEDDLYVIATLRLEDKLRLPLFLNGTEATLTDSNGAETNVGAVNKSDLQRLESIFPALAPMLPHPLYPDDEVQPGSTVEGQVVLPFPGMNEAAWKSKKSAVLKINLRNQSPQTVDLP